MLDELEMLAAVSDENEENKKQRATTAVSRINIKKKSDFASKLYRIPSLSKCLEFEILPRNSNKFKQILINNPLTVEKQSSLQPATLTAPI